jgi:Pentapeptide repeats (8 copies)
MLRRFRQAWATWPGRLIVLSTLLVLLGLWLAYRYPTAAWFGLGLAGVGGLLLLVGCLIVFPPVFAGPATERTTERLTLENEIRTTLLQALLGAVVLLGAVSAWQQFVGTSQELKISRNTQITGQLSAATEQLGGDKVEVRLGAIYTLDRLLRTAEGPDGQQDSLTVYNLLAGYIKARSPWPARPLDEDEQRRRVDRYLALEIESLRKRAPDVQLALAVVGIREKRLPPSLTFTPFLADTDLRGATLSGLRLHRADLRGAHLDYANARMPFEGEQTDLSGADLRGASLRCAHLEGTDLTDAKLQGADLRDAVLAGYKDKLRPATLTRVKLDGAVYNGRTQWPNGFRPPLDTMKWDDTTLAIRGTELLTVKGGLLARIAETGKTVVRDGMAVERNGKSLGNHPEPVAEAEVLPCDGRQIGRRLYRPGMTRCPPTADTHCTAAQAAAVSRKSVAEQLLEEVRAAAKSAGRG